jgi:hypothetical protein
LDHQLSGEAVALAFSRLFRGGEKLKGPEETEQGGFDWRTIDWKVWLARVLVVGLVLWVLAGGVRTAIQAFFLNIGGFFAYVPLGPSGGALAKSAEFLLTIETISFRIWVAAGVLLGFLWLRPAITLTRD